MLYRDLTSQAVSGLTQIAKNKPSNNNNNNKRDRLKQAALR